MAQSYYLYNPSASHASQNVAIPIRFLTILTGFIVVTCVLYFAHMLADYNPEAALKSTHPAPGASDPFDPFKCQAPPSDCWDGYMKKGGLQCVVFKKPAYLRGRQVLAPAQSRTCYKAVYFNLERTTGIIALLFLAWGSIVREAAEQVFTAVYQRTANKIAVLALLANLQSLWYSFSVIIHYLNDGFYNFFWSQLYFSLSDTYVYIIAILTVNSVRAAPIPRNLIMASLSISAYHMFQIVLDESSQTQWIGMLRNTLIFSCDFLMFLSMFLTPQVQSLYAESKKSFLTRLGIGMLVNLIIFQLLFADEASFRV